MRPGLRNAEQVFPIDYLLQEIRDDSGLTIFKSLLDAPGFGRSPRGAVSSSPQYFLFPRGRVPAPRPVPQRRGGAKYLVEPTRDCLILRCGGLHEPTGALVAGELQQPLDPGRGAVELFEIYARELLRGFQPIGMYWLGPMALQGFEAGQRLVTIGVRSPREYDLSRS